MARNDVKDGLVSLPIIGGTGDYDDAGGDVTTSIDRHGRPQHHGSGGPHRPSGGHGEEREFKLTVDLD